MQAIDTLEQGARQLALDVMRKAFADVAGALERAMSGVAPRTTAPVMTIKRKQPVRVKSKSAPTPVDDAEVLAAMSTMHAMTTPSIVRRADIVKAVVAVRVAETTASDPIAHLAKEMAYCTPYVKSALSRCVAAGKLKYSATRGWEFAHVERS